MSEKTETTRPTLSIGSLCHYFLQGDRQAQPCAALVTNTNKSGCLGLAIIPADSANFFREVSVRHINDPWLKTTSGKAILARSGAWEFLPADNGQPLAQLMGIIEGLKGRLDILEEKRGPGRPRTRELEDSGLKTMTG